MNAELTDRPQISLLRLEELYEEMLDECYAAVTIGSSSYQASTVLKNTDPVAFEAGMNDYASFLIEDGYEVEGY